MEAQRPLEDELQCSGGGGEGSGEGGGTYVHSDRRVKGA